MHRCISIFLTEILVLREREREREREKDFAFIRLNITIYTHITGGSLEIDDAVVPQIHIASYASRIL